MSDILWEQVTRKIRKTNMPLNPGSVYFTILGLLAKRHFQWWKQDFTNKAIIFITCEFQSQIIHDPQDVS